jgi:hypothetical protein
MMWRLMEPSPTTTIGKALHVVDRQLALAGVRLAHLLKEALRGADACQ